MKTERFLKLPIHFLTEGDKVRLTLRCGRFPSTLVVYDKGFWVKVPHHRFIKDNVRTLRQDGYSETLITLFAGACITECTWVNIDTDCGESKSAEAESDINLPHPNRMQRMPGSFTIYQGIPGEDLEDLIENSTLRQYGEIDVYIKVCPYMPESIEAEEDISTYLAKLFSPLVAQGCDVEIQVGPAGLRHY